MRLRYLSLAFICFVSSVILTACNPFERPAKAGLQVLTDDLSASLFLDGQYLDKTPFIAKDLKPGSFTLRIEPDDHSLAAYETTVNLQKDVLTVVVWKPGPVPELSGGVIYEMEKLPNKKDSHLSLITIPDNAIVAVDGQSKDFAPLVITDIKPGQHEFEVSLPSYESQKHSINIVEGYRVNVTVKLAKGSPNADAPSDLSSPTATGSASPTPKTATASASPKVTPKATVKPSASPTATPKAATSSATQRVPATGQKVKIKPTGYFQEGKEVLRVRDSASPAGKEIGVVEVGQEYAYGNKTENGWYALQFTNTAGQTTAGWVSGQYAELTP